MNYRSRFIDIGKTLNGQMSRMHGLGVGELRLDMQVHGVDMDVCQLTLRL